jgi:hypothetical protein
MASDESAARLDPTNRLLAVIDDPRQADAVRVSLAAAGIPADGVEVLTGALAAERLDPLGKSGGWWLRVKRVVGFTQADQSVDLALYAAALREGRAVVALRAPAAERDAAAGVLRTHGAHFVNFYGTLVTEEIIPWRGERPQLPEFLQR